MVELEAVSAKLAAQKARLEAALRKQAKPTETKPPAAQPPDGKGQLDAEKAKLAAEAAQLAAKKAQLEAAAKQVAAMRIMGNAFAAAVTADGKTLAVATDNVIQL